MREEIAVARNEASQRRTFRYGWRMNRQWEQVAGSTSSDFALPTHGSRQQFIVEHYWGYSAQPDGSCLEYLVRHPRWRVAEAEEASLECDVERLYGPEFAESLAGPPDSAMLVDGSDVTVSRGRRLAKKP